MKLTTKQLRKIILEELEQIDENDSGYGGSASALMGGGYDDTCAQIRRGQRPSRLSDDDEYEKAKERCERRRQSTSQYHANQAEKAEQDSLDRAAKNKRARLDGEASEEYVNNFVNKMNSVNDYVVDSWFSNSYQFPKTEFHQIPVSGINTIREKHPEIFGSGQYNNPIKMNVINDAGGFGSFLRDNDVFIGIYNNKIDLDPEAYLKAAKKARGIKDTSSSSSKGKGFFGKLKSLVGLEESKISITSKELKQIVKEEIKIILSEGVPQEAKEKVPKEAKKELFKKMKKKNQVPDGADIDDADFWEVKEGDHGYNDAVIIDGKRYYGEI